MADTSSIASRMEKLAKLKRMKLEKASGGDVMDQVDSHLESPPVSQVVTEPTTLPEADEAIQLSAPQKTSEAVSAPNIDSEIEGNFVSPSDTDDSNDSPEISTSDTMVDDADLDTSDFSELEGGDLDLGSELPTDLLDVEEFVANDAAKAAAAETEMLADDTADDTATANTEPTADDNANNSDADAPMSAEDLGIDEDETDALDPTAAIAAAAGVGVGLAAHSTAEHDIPDFAEKEIDIATLEREFEHEAATTASAPSATKAEDGLVTLTFDDSRSTLLNHVSRQMDCSVEDVVVTALDWYLDALFGEEGEEAKSA